ncbi:MAG: energy transducer TonB [Bacteroidia bacterium]
MKNTKFIVSIIMSTLSFVAVAQTQIENVPVIVVPPDNPVENQEDVVYTIVENMPQFKNKENKDIIEFLAANLIYPQVAIDEEIEGTVYVNFIVEKDGALSNYNILRDVQGTDLLGKEALRVIKLTSGMWTPGTQREKAVRVYYNIPVRFKLK